MNNIEKRINRRLLTYWSNLKKNTDNVPYEDTINPNEIEDLWQNCFVISTDNNRYNYLGENIIAIQNGQSVIAQDVYSSLLCPNKSNIPSIVNEIVASKSPITQDSQFENKYGVIIKYRRCFLPLSDKSGNVTFILGGLRWKSH